MHADCMREVLCGMMEWCGHTVRCACVHGGQGQGRASVGAMDERAHENH